MERKESRAEGERPPVVRQATRRFGAGTADLLPALFVPVGDSDSLAQVAEWIFNFTSGADLIDHVAALAARGQARTLGHRIRRVPSAGSTVAEIAPRPISFRSGFP